MLTINIPGREIYIEKNHEFVNIKPQKIVLEHSLVSISKWESKYKKSFLSNKNKSVEEIVDYVRFMTITQNVDPMAYYALTDSQIKQITDYIEDPYSATTFHNQQKSGKKEIVTSELIYYWMISLGIPFECKTWHLNRLLTLINICSIKNSPSKKMPMKDNIAQRNQLNAMRRAKSHH